MLVGHSYGGNVISMAAAGNDEVKALSTSTAGCATRARASSSSWRGSKAAAWGPRSGPCRTPSRIGIDGSNLDLDPGAFRETFAADVDPDTAAAMAAAQRPYAAAAFAGTPSGPPAWKTLPCWYLLGTEDKAIPPALQHFMAERADATIVEVPAFHVSFVSQPEAATQLTPPGRRGGQPRGVGQRLGRQLAASMDVVFDVAAGRRGVVMWDGHRVILIEFRPKTSMRRSHAIASGPSITTWRAGWNSSSP